MVVDPRPQLAAVWTKGSMLNSSVQQKPTTVLSSTESRKNKYRYDIIVSTKSNRSSMSAYSAMQCARNYSHTDTVIENCLVRTA
jgi:DNA topoisomerase VI subunit B